MQPKRPDTLRKSRGDIMLNARLTPEAARALFKRLENGGLTIAKARDYLLETHGIRVDPSTIGRWAAKRRRTKADGEFARLLESIKADKQQALDLGREVGEAHRLNDASRGPSPRERWSRRRSAARSSQRARRATEPSGAKSPPAPAARARSSRCSIASRKSDAGSTSKN